MTTIRLSLDTNYVPRWGIWEALRELLQNALDAQDLGHPMEVRHWPDTNRVVIRNTEGSYETLQMGRERLLLGSTSKLGTSARGQFGEGFKLALLVLARKGIPVTVHTPDETWKPCIEAAEQFGGAEVLSIKVTPRASAKRTVEFVVTGVDKASWDGIVSRVLPLQQDVRRVQTAYGDVLLDESFRGKLYVRGLFVGELPDNYRWGYDLRSVDLDRDRRMADPWSLRHELARTLTAAVENGGLQVRDVMDRGYEEAVVLANTVYTAGPIAARVATQFEADYGEDAVAVESMEEAAMASQYGLQAVVVTREERALIESVKGDLHKRLSNRSLDVKRIVQPGELSAIELDNVAWATKLVKAAHPFEEAVQVVEFYSDSIHGRTDGATIQLASRIVGDRKELVATLVHEVAHKYGPDGAASHREAIERIFAAIVVALSA